MRSRAWLLTLVVILAGVGTRLVALDADPPTWHHLGFLSDEGWWAANARNKVLFGSFVIDSPRDEFNQGLVVSPVFTLLCWGSFALFGPSLWSLRLVSALMAGVTAVGLAAVAARTLGRSAAPLAGLLYLFEPFTWALGRVGLVEETMNAMIALALACWVSRRGGFAIAAGVFMGLAFATKSYAAAAGVAMAVDALATNDERTVGQRVGALARCGAGAAAVLVAWGVTVYLPFRDDYRELSLKLSQDNLPHGPGAALRNAADLLLELPGDGVRVAAWIRTAPVAAVLLGLGLSLAVALSLAALRRERALVLALPILAAYVAVLAPMQQKPDRRYEVLVIPEVLVACWALGRLRAGAGEARAPRSAWRRIVAALPLAALVAAPAAASLRDDRTGAAVVFALATAFASLPVAWARPWILAAARRGAALAPAAILVVFVAFVAPPLASPSFTERDEGRALGREVGDAMVMGGVAHSLLLESRSKVFNSMRKGTAGRFNGDLLERARVPFVLTWDQPGRPWREDGPETFGPATKVREDLILPAAGSFRARVTLWRREIEP